jgi:hypothetical protein
VPETNCTGFTLTSLEDDRRVCKNLANLSKQFAASADCGFIFHKRCQLFIRAHNETLSVVSVRVCNPSSVRPLESIAETQPHKRKEGPCDAALGIVDAHGDYYLSLRPLFLG